MLRTKALRGSQKAWRFPAQVSQKASEAPNLRGVPSSSRGSQELPETPVKILELAKGSHAICMHGYATEALWQRNGSGTGDVRESSRSAMGEAREQYMSATGRPESERLFVGRATSMLRTPCGYQAYDGCAIKRNWSVAERLPELFGNGAGLLSQTDSGTGVLQEWYKIPTGVPWGVLWGNVTPALRNRHRSDPGKVLAGHEKGSGGVQNETEMACGTVMLQ